MKAKRGFSLMEVIVVIAIMGVLSAILIPGVSSVQGYLMRSKNKIFLSELVMALESYKATYGFYPRCLKENCVNDSRDVAEPLFMSLSGRMPNGAELSPSEREKFNKKAVCFYEFHQENLKEEGPRHFLMDYSGNEHIFFVVKAKSESIIPESLIPHLSRSLLPQNVFRKNIICYTLSCNEKNAEPVVCWGH